MNWIGNFVTFVSKQVGDFGLAVVVLVLASQILLIPAKIFARKNRKAKQACEPEIRAIRKKYNANQLGVSMDDPKDLDPAVRKMSHDERDEAMANEIDAVYKKHGYHMWTAWIPLVINLSFLIILWRGIVQAAPEGFYRVTAKTLDINSPDAIWNILFFAASPALSFISGCVSLCTNIMKNKKAGIALKPVVMAGFITLILSVALSTWIATSISTALAIALFVVSAWSIITAWISKLINKTPADAL